MVGQQINQYRIVRRLGHGAMGSVYEAVDGSIERRVALKVLNAELSGRPDLEQRFTDEAKALAKLSHPNVATLFQFFVWQDQPVAVMEYLEGGSIGDLLEREGSLPVARAVDLCQQALCGVAAAHKRGIIHRDLKPGNLMRNEDGIVKVIDFGIAKMKDNRRLTQVGGVVGTYFYMSPEQITGKTVEAQTDIYSMGVVLYEMLVGDVPFDGETDFELRKAHVETPPPRPSLRNPKISEGLERVLLRALAKAPGDRYESADKFREALAAASLQPSTPPARPLREDTFVEPRAPEAAPGFRAVDESHAVPLQAEKRKKKRRSAVITVAGTALAAAMLVALWVWAKPNGAEHKDTSASLHQPAPAPPPSQAPPRARPISRPASIAKPKPSGSNPPEIATPPQPAPRTTPAVPDPVPVSHTPVVSAAAAQGLTGSWQGLWKRTVDTSLETTPVSVNLVESEEHKVTGTLEFTSPDKSQETCDVRSSRYTPETSQLQLLTFCKDPAHPVMFNFPMFFNGVGPHATSLSGRAQGSQYPVVATLQRK